jgi:hypothetical protein
MGSAILSLGMKIIAGLEGEELPDERSQIVTAVMRS